MTGHAEVAVVHAEDSARGAAEETSWVLARRPVVTVLRWAREAWMSSTGRETTVGMQIEEAET